MWGRLNAPHHPQPRRGCRPSRHAIVPDVVLASKVEAIRNGIVVNCTLMLVVLAFQIKAIRNTPTYVLLDLVVVLAFQIKAIRNGTKQKVNGI